MTITGILSVLFLVYVILKHRLKIYKIVLDPYFWICWAFLKFFGFADITRESSLIADLANLLTLIIFSLSYHFAINLVRRKTFVRLITNAWPVGTGCFFLSQHTKTFTLSTSVLWMLFAGVLCWGISDLYANTIAYGSIDQALVRFYLARPVNEIPRFTLIFLNILNTFSMLSLLLFRFNMRISRSVLSRYLFWFSLLLYELVVIPRGTVGMVMYPIVLMFAVDALLLKRGDSKRWPYYQYLIVFPLLFFIGFVLLNIRGVSFSSVQDVLDNLMIGFDESGYTETSLKSHSIVFEYVEHVIQLYGSSRNYHYFHTPYSIIVNPIPREVWPEKPIGFGKLIAIEDGAPVDTSASFAAGIAGEGYFNGGWVGILLLSLVIGFISGLLAKFSATLFQSLSLVHIVVGFQLWIGAQSFVRGDMLSAWQIAIYQPFFTIIALWFITKVKYLFSGSSHVQRIVIRPGQ